MLVSANCYEQLVAQLPGPDLTGFALRIVGGFVLIRLGLVRFDLDRSQETRAQCPPNNSPIASMYARGTLVRREPHLFRVVAPFGKPVRRRGVLARPDAEDPVLA